MMTIHEIAVRLHDLVKQGDNTTAYKDLFADNAVAIEPNFPGFEKVEGLQNIREKGQVLIGNIQEIKNRKVSEQIVVGDNHISLGISLDAILKDGSSFKFSEVALYEVDNGQIISEQFFY
ncbi:MAG: nuclear transport factor 2 family protein [Cyclobacteriaceae bacterium]